MEFQSLFWWKYCPGGGGSLPVAEVHASFNPCSGGSIALGEGREAGCWLMNWFQSLFWWKYCPGTYADFRLVREDQVSILVLVEVLPWVHFMYIV